MSTYRLIRTKQFKKDFKLCEKRNYDLSILESVLKLLQNGDTIPEKYKDHPLKNSKSYKECRELHLEPNWLLIYKYSNNNVILKEIKLIRLGTHSDLFEK